MGKYIILGILVLSGVDPAAAQCWGKLTGDKSGIKDKQTIIVRTQQEWEGLWKRHNQGIPESERAPLPPVNFSKVLGAPREMVAALFLGDEVNDAQGLELLYPHLDRSQTDESRLIIPYRGKFPIGKGSKTPSLKQLFAIQRLPGYYASVVFEYSPAHAIPPETREKLDQAGLRIKNLAEKGVLIEAR